MIANAVFVLTTIDLYLVISTFLLGFRHGIDWDHIAAILDLTGSGSIQYDGSVAVSQFHHRSVKLATWYALGHASIVVALGLIIRACAAVMPPWFYRATEQLVGVTLVVFGLWIVIAIGWSVLSNRPAAVASRGVLIAALCDRLVSVFRPRGNENANIAAVPLGSRRLPAFMIGVIHGIGAETSTQLLLLASIAAASNAFMVACLLVCFAGGLVCSNSLIALAAATGFLTVSSVRPLYLGLGILASGFSVYVGTTLLTGTNELPPMAQTIDAITTCLRNYGVMM